MDLTPLNRVLRCSGAGEKPGTLLRLSAVCQRVFFTAGSSPALGSLQQSGPPARQLLFQRSAAPMAASAVARQQLNA